MLATRSPRGEIASDPKVWIGADADGGEACAKAASAAVSAAARKKAVIFIEDPWFLRSGGETLRMLIPNSPC
jgi:hypothetical protein